MSIKKFKLISLMFSFFLINLNIYSGCLCNNNNNNNNNSETNNNDNEKNDKSNQKKDNKKEDNLKIKDLMNKFKDQNNRKNEYFKEYKKLYDEMTNDIFTEEVTLELISYIYILKKRGFIDALNNIFNQNIVFYSYLKFLNTRSETIQITEFYFDEFEEDNNIKCKISVNKDGLSKNCKERTSGSLYINDEKFKYLRCKGCNDSNCICCRLRIFLEEQKIKDKFKKIFQDQGKDSNSESSLDIKKFIYQSLKNEYKNIDFFTKVENLNKSLDEDFRKCIFIEWALTILFLERFIKYIYEENGKLNLYRSTFAKENNLIENITKTDLFESTSIFGPVFLLKNGYNLLNLNNFEFFEVKDVKFYRCLFNYIISFENDTIFGVWGDGDVEQEIGFIPINYNYHKMSGTNSTLDVTKFDKKSKKEKTEIGEHFINHYKFIDDVCKDILKRCLQKKYTSKNIEIEILDKNYILHKGDLKDDDDDDDD